MLRPISSMLLVAALAGPLRAGDKAADNKTVPAATKSSAAQGASTQPAHGVSAVSARSPSAQDDKALELALRTKLAKSKIGKDGFTVHVQGGVAYWEGSTDVVQHKGAATRMAKSSGARSVVNNIKINDAAKQKAADNLDQGRRRAQVKRSDPRTQETPR